MISLLNASAENRIKPAKTDISATVATAIQITGLRFAWNPSSPPVLHIPALEIETGQKVFVQGPSGSGKSTLLGLLAGIMAPQSGRIRVLGNRLDQMNGVERDRFRADHLGIIFQMFNLIPYLSVVENVTLPCHFSRSRQAQATRNSGIQTEARRLLSRLGLADSAVLSRPVTELSVGQQQRVAAARALMGSPEILIADEPTSALDTGHRRAFIDLLFAECARAQSTLVFVSHDTSLAARFDRSVRLSDINHANRDSQDHSQEVN